MSETPVPDSPGTSPKADDGGADYWPEPMSPHRDDAAIRAEAREVLEAWLGGRAPVGVTMTADVAAALRAPFPAEQTGKLPKITCRACSKAPGRVCGEHQKAECPSCGNYITKRHIDLDYVGHGAVTDRLLSVDPAWSWEPLAWEGEPWRSVPAFVYDDDRPVGLWMTLTVAGVTRLGMGTCERGQVDAEKVLIGDALRNAAMRFGVALDLWVRGHADDAEAQTTGRTRPQAEPDTGDKSISDKVFHELAGRISALPEPQREAIADTWLDLGLPEQNGKPAVRLLRQRDELAVRGIIDAVIRAAILTANGAPQPEPGPDSPADPPAGPPADAQASDTDDEAKPAAPDGDEVRRAEIEAEVETMTVASVRESLMVLGLDTTGSGRDVRHRLIDARLAALQEASSDG